MAQRVCPWWLGYFLLSPLRRLRQDPATILRPYVDAGMTVLDAGCGMGYFSLPLAQRVGPQGRVVCVDIQTRMLRALDRRAQRAGLSTRIETRLCSPENLGLDDLEGQVDFALAFAVAHEVPDASGFLEQLHNALRTGGHLLLAEPRAHVSALDFEQTLTKAAALGFRTGDAPRIRHARAAVLAK